MCYLCRRSELLPISGVAQRPRAIRAVGTSEAGSLLSHGGSCACGPHHPGLRFQPMPSIAVARPPLRAIAFENERLQRAYPSPFLTLSLIGGARCVRRGTVLLRPILSAVIDAQDFDGICLDAGDEDEGGDHELAGCLLSGRSGHDQAWSQATCRRCQRVLATFRAAAGLSCRMRRVMRERVVGCQCRPSYQHQDCKMRSTLAHTSAEATNSPRSAAAMPRFTASAKRASSSRRRVMAS
jgi:hypothetical protein